MKRIIMFCDYCKTIHNNNDNVPKFCSVGDGQTRLHGWYAFYEDEIPEKFDYVLKWIERMKSLHQYTPATQTKLW